MNNLMQPPASVANEEAVIASVMIDPSTFRAAALAPADFWVDENRAIWGMFGDMEAAGTPLDVLTVQHELDRRGILKTVGVGYMARLVGSVPSAYNVAAYADTVRKAAIARNLLTQAQAMARAAYALDIPAAGQAVEKMRGVLVGSSSGTAQTIAEVAGDNYDRYANPGQAARDFQQTGIGPLDMVLGGGLNLGTLTVVMARPGMGKTALLCQIADTVSEAGQVVVFASKEMSRNEILDRMAARRARCNLQRWRQGEATDDERARMSAELVSLMGCETLYLDSRRVQTTAELWAECGRVKDRAGRLDLVMGDHLRLFADTADNEVHRLGKIAWAFKQMAGELGCRSILAAQLSRGVEGQQDKRPDLKDLRDSGEIEEDADNVIGLYRDKYYDPKANMVAELLIRKCRDGARGDKAEMIFQDRYMGFERKAIERD